jgi:hypothetical protein
MIKIKEMDCIVGCFFKYFIYKKKRKKEKKSESVFFSIMFIIAGLNNQLFCFSFLSDFYKQKIFIISS